MNTTTTLFRLLILTALIMLCFFFIANATFATEIESNAAINVESTDDDNNAEDDDTDEDGSEDEDEDESDDDDIDEDEDESEDESDDASDDVDDGDDDSGSDDDNDMDEDESDDDKHEDNILRANLKERMNVQQERRQELQERKEIRQTELENRIEQSRMVRIDMRVALGKRIVVRLDHIHDRLETILGKISSRVEADNESDTADIKEQTTKVADYLDEAATHITNLEAMIDAWVTVNTTSDAQQLSTELQANKDIFKETVQSAGQALRSAHKSLKELVHMLKSYEKDNRIETRVESETNVEI